MTGHVAQYFLTDDSWRELLAHVHRALRPGGRLAFESRNPGARAWERWIPEFTRGTYPHPAGGTFTSWIEMLDVQGDPAAGIIETHRGVTERAGTKSYSAPETLAFRPPATLETSLEQAGFDLERRFGDWSRGAVTAQSPEHILVSRRL
ncbi:MAG: hypothetical protein ACTHXC_08240 [Brachybacterium sp.]